MIDWASTETKFNKLLKDYNESVQPEFKKNDNKQAVSSMSNFCIGLHTLVHLADDSQKTVYQIKNPILTEITRSI